MAIEELSRSPGNNRILDIGAHEGFLCEALVRLGYSAAALDFESHLEKSLWEESGIEWRQCHIEGDPIPFPDEHFGAVYMGQLLEHLTYSPKKPFQEIRRVLKPGGLLAVDANAGEWHKLLPVNQVRTFCGTTKHYLDYEPYLYKGRPYFDRHNHEFTG
jgi:SAM-dependent methyltransferase